MVTSFSVPEPLTVTVFRGLREETGLPARLRRNKGNHYGYIHIFVCCACNRFLCPPLYGKYNTNISV